MDADGSLGLITTITIPANSLPFATPQHSSKASYVEYVDDTDPAVTSFCCFCSRSPYEICPWPNYYSHYHRHRNLGRPFWKYCSFTELLLCLHTSLQNEPCHPARGKTDSHAPTTCLEDLRSASVLIFAAVFAFFRWSPQVRAFAPAEPRPSQSSRAPGAATSEP